MRSLRAQLRPLPTPVAAEPGGGDDIRQQTSAQRGISGGGAALDAVDPFIGVDGPGAVLPGPYHPLGLVRLGPDTEAPNRTNGYQSERPIGG
eukprot:COSAG04_NODE_1498_length_6526_cov_3.081064_3_plen_92_part_00